MILSDRVKLVLGTALVLLGMYGYTAWKDHQINAAGQAIEMLEAQRDVLSGKLSEQMEQIAGLNDSLKVKEVQVANLRKTVAELPKPKPPVPIPAIPEEQVRYFQSYHLSPLVVPGVVGALAFTSKDIPVIGQALQDSGNLPRVSEQLRHTQLLVQELDGLGAVKDTRIAAGDKSISTLQGQVAICDQLNEQYQKQVKAERSKSRVQKILWGAAGIGVGFLVAKR